MPRINEGETDVKSPERLWHLVGHYYDGKWSV